jgi:hypothetical protein
LSKKELRMLWGMHKKLKNQPKSWYIRFDINKLISIYPLINDKQNIGKT